MPRSLVSVIRNLSVFAADMPSLPDVTAVVHSSFSNLTLTNLTNPSGGSSRRGWVSAPNERGTIDIIWSCVSTLTICLWTMLHLNVPATRDSYWTMFWRKSRWLLLGILAPEVPVLFACGQWASANRSVSEMRALGYSETQWSLVHAFYADSGGFVLRLPDTRPFPITARQVRYLVQHGYVSLPSISKKEIWDKSNADKVAKFIACFQTAWLATQVLGRAVQHLPITPLELATIVTAFCSLTMLGFWLHKPLDVEAPTLLPINSTITDILAQAGEAAKEPYRDSPLDFVEPRVYMSGKWSNMVCRWILRRGLQTRPIERIPNDRDPQLSSFRQHLALGVATASFASIHLAGWNFSFPTSWEAIFWRSNCLIMWGLLAIYGTTEVAICWWENYENLGLDTLGGYKLKWPACLCFFVPAGLYMGTRLCLIAEAVMSLRSLPEGAFAAVDWSAVLPHI